MILEVFSNLYNSVIPSHFTFLIINVLNNEIYTIVYPSNEKNLQSSCSSINSLKGGSIDIFGNLCNKKKVILQCLFMPYYKGMNVVKSTENCVIPICILILCKFPDCFLLTTLYISRNHCIFTYPNQAN